MRTVETTPPPVETTVVMDTSNTDPTINELYAFLGQAELCGATGDSVVEVNRETLIIMLGGADV